MEVNWQKLNIPNKQVSVHTWDAPYAAGVHEGMSSRNGKDLPARPWVNHTIDNHDLLEIYAESFQQSEDFIDAFEQMSQEFGDKCQEAIEDEIWDWPRDTKRKNGDVVGSPRDIVDTGKLKDSYSMEIL
jgi:hypothetical protein